MNNHCTSKKEEILNIIILFFITSFIGWIYESILNFIINHSFIDIGFLSLPICPIYGFTMTLLYVFIGLVSIPKGIYKLIIYDIKNKLLARIIFYSIFSFLIVNTLELITGFIFNKVFSIRLWDYSHIPYNLNGYISLFTSLGWLILIPLAMELIYKPIYYLIKKVSFKIRLVISMTLIIFFILDFSFNIIHLVSTNERFTLFKYYLKYLSFF